MYPVLNWTENPGTSAGLIFGALLVLICKDIMKYIQGDLQRLETSETNVHDQFSHIFYTHGSLKLKSCFIIAQEVFPIQDYFEDP